MCVSCFFFFFLKQKTAYDMRISDWSSDVCSSDLLSKKRDADDGQEQLSDENDGLPLIGRSAAMQEVYRTIARVISNDLTILVLGESGTGKELVAEAIHNLGHRRGRPFVAINMAAIPRELLESELFGHEKGAFTGAQARTSGRFYPAQGGTLLLGEIGDIPMAAQTALLSVLQPGEFNHVDGARTIRAHSRIDPLPQTQPNKHAAQ